MLDCERKDGRTDRRTENLPTSHLAKAGATKTTIKDGNAVDASAFLDNTHDIELRYKLYGSWERKNPV